jgi:ankyrin repeat protein
VGSVRALLAAGADREATIPAGDRQLHWSTPGGHAEVVRALVTAVADPEAIQLERGRRPAHYAAERGHVDALLDLGSSLDALSGGSWHCLHLLARNPAMLQPQQLQAVLDAGAKMAVAVSVVLVQAGCRKYADNARQLTKGGAAAMQARLQQRLQLRQQEPGEQQQQQQLGEGELARREAEVRAATEELLRSAPSRKLLNMEGAIAC